LNSGSVKGFFLAGDGGALAFIDVVGGSVAENKPVEGNDASVAGGAFYFRDCNKLNVAGNLFKDNKATEGKDIFCRHCTGADESALKQQNPGTHGADPDVKVQLK
jgi:hypothetical protein